MSYRLANLNDVLRWINDGVITVEERDGEMLVLKSGKALTARINKRRKMAGGDPRVDLSFGGRRRSVHVSSVVWMAYTRQVVPLGFEIHHRDEDPLNNAFSNLLCVHHLDHQKLHNNHHDEAPF